MTTPLATPDDVAVVWRPLTPDETVQVEALILRASAKLRHAARFNIDAAIAVHASDPTSPQAIDPIVVADVVATVVKRFLVNPNGAASENVGPYSRVYVARSDKSGADVRGALAVTASDLEQLVRGSASGSRTPRMIQLHPTRQMNPVSQWSGRYAVLNPATGLPDASYDPLPGDVNDPNEYDPSYEPDPTEYQPAPAPAPPATP